MAAENALKSKEVSAMIKQGFIPETAFSFSPTRTISRVGSPSSTPSKTLHSPPPSSSAANQSPSSSFIQIRPGQSQTLLEMMSEEQCRESKLSEEKRRKVQDRVSKLLEEAPFKDPAWGGLGDVRLTIIARDGFKVSLDVHKSVLAKKSRFFAEKLPGDRGVSHSVEISDCDDVEAYLETVVLMYCRDLKKRLIGDNVTKVLSLLKVSAAIMFDLGVESCLEYLEAVPWSEDEEQEVISQLGTLQIDDPRTETLLRISSDPSTSARADDIFLRLLSSVLQAKDDKARREMKTLISRMFKEATSHESSRIDVSKDTLYNLCHRCLSSLVLSLSEATNMDEQRDRGILMGDIAREADNIQWLVDILINKKMADEFVKVWADQKELATLHSKIPTIYRHEISRITAQLCIAIGKGFILVPKDTRFSLLSTWLEALYDDFGWMRRASKSVDKKLIEDGLSQTILTLPLLQQQAVLLNWFDRFLNKGDDCPNIQKAFEVWWRRAFVRQYEAEQDNSHLQITVCDYPT